MPTSEYDREIIKLLREGYRIDVGTKDIKKTGSHRGLEIVYKGNKVAITLHDSKQRQGSGDLLAMKIADIRRELDKYGPPHPSVLAPTLKKTIDDITPKPPATVKPPSAIDQLAHKTIAELRQLAVPTKPEDITPAYLKSLIDAVNYVTTNTEWRMSRNNGTGKYRFFRIIE
jgi:hypothetical protein